MRGYDVVFNVPILVHFLHVGGIVTVNGFWDFDGERGGGIFAVGVGVGVVSGAPMSCDEDLGVGVVEGRVEQAAVVGDYDVGVVEFFGHRDGNG